jgi:hypothetical protein
MADIIEELNQSFEDPAIDGLTGRAAMEIYRLRQQVKKLTAAIDNPGWRTYEDRMGGQFTQEEIDRSARGGEGW